MIQEDYGARRRACQVERTAGKNSWRCNTAWHVQGAVRNSDWLEIKCKRACRGEASHQQLLMLIFMGLKSLLRSCGGGCGRERTGDEKCGRAPYGVYHTASTPLQNVNKGYVENVQPGFCVTLPLAAQTDVSRRGKTKHPVVTQY